MFEQAFKNIDDILHKDAGCTSELDYTEQSSWLLFLKYLDALEREKAMEAELEGHKYDWLQKNRPHDQRGSHGYDPDLPQMRAAFIATGPAFRDGVRLPVFDNVDVYPLLMRLLQLPAEPGDGDIAPLLPALRER